MRVRYRVDIYRFMQESASDKNNALPCATLESPPMQGQQSTQAKKATTSPSCPLFLSFLQHELTSREIWSDNVQFAVGHKGTIDAQNVGVFAQCHDLGFPPKLVNLVAFKHIKVNNLDGDSPVQGFVVSIIHDR